MTRFTIDNFQPAEYRQALGTFATGVSVITASTDKGEVAGLTVNSFTSVSLQPPLILWCLASSSESLGVFKRASHFAVNILAAEQVNLSTHFATKQDNKFKSIKFLSGQGGAPLLADCVTWLQCQTTAQYELGDHWVFVGHVLEVETTSREALLFHQGQYAMSLPFPGPASFQHPLKDDYSDKSLYSLMIEAVHAYQEKFEARQHELTDNAYEARILEFMHDKESVEVTELSRGIQLPTEEMSGLLDDMQGKSLVAINVKHKHNHIVLTPAGKGKAALLWELAKQHEQDAISLFRQGDAETFRMNLIQLINWSTHT
jgi:flavin reductase (DIM6/NTAB) family NADH-FMN oxidoreductase RutF/DNA-binding MarR family transcriptional regulator